MRCIAAFFILFSFSLPADNDYHYFINLTKVNNDKVSVRLQVPDMNQNEVEFCFPAMVPGTYEVYNFGRYISNFKVSGKNGAEIKVVKKDQNIWKLSPASQISEISYDVDDTWDKKDDAEAKQKVIFEPAGTNIEDGKDFCINTHGFFGYFRDMTGRNFIMEFEKPKNFYPSTGLSDIKIGDSKDVLSVFDYHNLVDSPIMYTVPDTSTIMVANTRVLVSCYSPNKKITSSFIARTLKELLNAQRDFLGGTLPVEKYAFLFYFGDKTFRSGAFGALEHSYSSFYTMPEIDSTYSEQEIRDVAAHEFFHIVTPLNIHSKEIGDFDFNKPVMSEHLWMYEGMTEYEAHLAQVKGGLISPDQFLGTMMEKYKNSLANYNDTMSFTWMSKHVLEEKIHPQYNNVYEKGAVICMCLDIMLRNYSDGAYGTQNLMKDLAKKYGKDRSFNDDDLFGDIEKLTYPQIGEFLRKHVGGHTPLPMKEVLSMVGIDFEKESVTYEFTFGNPDLDYNETTGRLVVVGVKHLDEFGKDLGYKFGDEISKINGREMKVEQAKEIITEYYEKIKEGDLVQIEIYRPKRKNKYKVKVLSAKAKKVKVVENNKVKLKENMSEKEKNTLRSWLGI
jgi:predicted metalloprotease with PDZ domain